MRRIPGLALLLVVVTATAQAADVSDLVKKLKAVDPDTRRSAARSLGEAGAEAKPAIPALIQSLKDKDAFVRRYAAEALAGVGAEPKVAIPPLVLATRDNRREVKEAAAAALGAMGPNAVAPLLDILKNGGAEAGVRRKAAEALGKIGPAAKSAIPALTEALQAAAPKAKSKGAINTDNIRLEVVNALGEIATADDKAAISALRGVTVRRDPAMSQAINAAVKKIQARK